MIVFRNNVWSGPGDLEATLQHVLEQQEAANLGELVAYTAFDAGTVRRQMARWADEGRVEVLRPMRATADDEQVFYRWRRARDGACLWQRDFFEGVRGPIGRHRIDELRTMERNMT